MSSLPVTRDESGLADLVRRLATLGPQLVALEATGGYEVVVAAMTAPLAPRPRPARRRHQPPPDPGVCALSRSTGQDRYAGRARPCPLRGRQGPHHRTLGRAPSGRTGRAGPILPD